MHHHTRNSVSGTHGCTLGGFTNRLLPIVSGLRHTLRGNSGRGRTTGTLLRKIRLALRAFVSAIRGFNLAMVGPINRTFGPRLRRTVNVRTDPSRRSGAMVVIVRGNCSLGRRMLHPTVMVITRWSLFLVGLDSSGLDRFHGKFTFFYLCFGVIDLIF